MKKMKQKQTYKFKVYPYLIFSIVFYLMLLTLIIIFGALKNYHYNNIVKTILNVLFIILIIFSCLSFIYSITLGWNTPIYFAEEKAYRKIHGKCYEWYWNDIERIDCRFKKPLFFCYPPYPPRIKLVTKSHNKKLSISCDKYFRKKITQFCKEEKFLKMYEDTLSKVEFPYF